jgi:pyrroline-5-carboxylate reductase
MKLGFVGVGAISQACIEALLTGPNADNLTIFLSPRSKERVEKLSSRFEQVVVAQNNQEVLDNSEIVFLGILPNQTKEVCADLKFKPDHIVGSLVAGFPPSLVREIVAPATQVAQLIPLPVIAMHAGPLVVCPGNSVLVDLFAGCGDIVVLADEDKILVLSCASAAMSSFFQYQNTVIDWSIAKGIDPEVSKAYATSLFKGLATEAMNTPMDQIAEMPGEHETPGGLNEYIRNTLTNAGMFKELQDALENQFQVRNQKKK